MVPEGRDGQREIKILCHDVSGDLKVRISDPQHIESGEIRDFQPNNPLSLRDKRSTCRFSRGVVLQEQQPRLRISFWGHETQSASCPAVISLPRVAFSPRRGKIIDERFTVTLLKKEALCSKEYPPDFS